MAIVVIHVSGSVSLMSGIVALSMCSSIDDARLRHSLSIASFPHFVLFRNNAALSFEAGRHLSAMSRPVFFVSLLSVAVHIWYELCLTLRTFLTN
jgi:hypothetical protein|nr:MAG TPA: hypothetical protein [Caudoviricetes sp.]